MDGSFHNNHRHSRFELEVGPHRVFATYRREGEVLHILHVEAPMELRGKGAAGRLMAEIAAQARAEGLKITPLCSYAAAWLQRHPEMRDLLAA